MSIAGVQPDGITEEAAAIAMHRRRDMPRDLKYVLRDGCAWAGMVGFGESLFQPMVLALALGEQAGQLAAFVPAFVGATCQLCTPWVVQKLGSHKRVVLAGSLLQVVSLVVMAVLCGAGAFGYGNVVVPMWVVLGVLSVYQFGGFSAASAWATWMGTIVPARIRGGYFSMRTRWLYLAQLLSLISASGLLAWAGGGEKTGAGVLWGFAASMVIASMFRTGSTVCEYRTTEPVPVPRGHRRVGLREAFWKLSHGPSAGLVGCYFLMAMAQSIATPSLVPMVMGPLHQPAKAATLVAGAMMLGRIGGYFLLPRLLKRWGAPRTLRAAGIALVPLFLIPAVMPNLPAVLVMHMLAGVVYACWEMSTWLLVLDQTPQGERTSYMGLLYFGTWLASYVGGSLGGQVLSGFRIAEVVPAAYELNGYRTVFVLSCIARAGMVVPLLLWVRRAERHRVNAATNAPSR
ncbi:MAG: MFS transporter [Phycisphaerales bacterium]